MQFWLMIILGSIFAILLNFSFFFLGALWGTVISLIATLLFLYLDSITIKLVLSKRNDDI